MPNHFYLDASALAKRYAPEQGTLVMNYLFSRVPPHKIYALHLSVAEVVSILVRKRNAKTLPPRLVSQAFTDFEVASDQRLLRATQAEGLINFNPENQTASDLDLLLV